MALIKLSNIEKAFKDGHNHLRQVLRGIDLEVEKGEFVAIKGDSGSGKTTLLSILGTLLQPDKGLYQLNGVEMVAPHADLSFVRNRDLGFVFQDHRLLPQYTAFENILLPTLAYATEASMAEIRYAKDLLALANISHVAGQYPTTLSGGEASRVAVCRALIRQPLLLLADEPTGQLDQKNAGHILRLFSDINKQLETTIIMVTHSDEISSITHRQLTLKGGILQ